MKISNLILFLITFSIIPISSYPVARIPPESKTQKSDHDLIFTRQLREVIMADNQLSTKAHNIKIMTVQNAVILEGQVNSRAEKVKIENMARARAGNKKVFNRLTY